jgi:hypothetical protein
MREMGTGRSWDRTVRVKKGQTILLASGDEELFVTANDDGLIVRDARGVSPMSVAFDVSGKGGLGKMRPLVLDVDRLLVRRRYS